MKIRVGNKQSHGMKCYASGGRVPEDVSDSGSLPAMAGSDSDDDAMGVDGGKAKPRLDRAGKKAPSTTINVIVAGRTVSGSCTPYGSADGRPASRTPDAADWRWWPSDDAQERRSRDDGRRRFRIGSVGKDRQEVAHGRRDLRNARPQNVG